MEKNKCILRENMLEQNNEYYRLYYWKYSDGSYRSILYDRSAAETEGVQTHDNKAILHLTNSRYQKLGIGTKKIPFASGITNSYFKNHKNDFLAYEAGVLEAGFQELQTMLAGYARGSNKEEILSLFSLVLSGYTARLCLKKQKDPTLYFSRAPIVLVRKNRDDLCGGFEHLARIAQSLIVDTGCSKWFKLKNPAVIPSKRRVSTIEDCANAYMLADKQKRCFPTLYRDTAVLIHSDFFSDSMLQRFAERNRWCTVFLFNQNKLEWQRLFAEIDMNEMSMPLWNWDPTKIHFLMQKYVLWLVTIKNERPYQRQVQVWNEVAEEMVHAYNLASVTTGYKIKQGSEFDLASLQIASLYSFVRYLEWEGILDMESCQALFDEWTTILLPGSRGKDLFVKKRKIEKEYQDADREKTVSELETLLNRICRYDDCGKVFYLAHKETYPTDHKLDLKKDHWAFLGKMNIKGRGEDIPVLKIKYRELLQLAKKFELLEGGNKTHESIKEAIKGRCYVQSMDTVRINFAKKTSSQTGLTLIVEEMQFLDKDLREMLMAKVSDPQ